VQVGNSNRTYELAFSRISISERKNTAVTLCTVEIPNIVDGNELDAIKDIANNVRRAGIISKKTSHKRYTQKALNNQGFKITVLAGYTAMHDDNPEELPDSETLMEEFTGWITEVSPTQPFVIKAMGIGVLLSETTVEKRYKKQRVSSIISELNTNANMPNAPIIDEDLGKMTLALATQKMTAQQVLSALTEKVPNSEFFVNKDGRLVFCKRNALINAQSDRKWPLILTYNTLEEKLKLKEDQVAAVKAYRPYYTRDVEKAYSPEEAEHWTGEKQLQIFHYFVNDATADLTATAQEMLQQRQDQEKANGQEETATQAVLAFRFKTSKHQRIGYFPEEAATWTGAEKEKIYAFQAPESDMNLLTEAKKKYHELNYQGFTEGSYVRTYGYPPIRIGQSVQVKDLQNRVKLNGVFIAAECQTHISAIAGGAEHQNRAAFERTVFLTRKLS